MRLLACVYHEQHLRLGYKTLKEICIDYRYRIIRLLKSEASVLLTVCL